MKKSLLFIIAISSAFICRSQGLGNGSDGSPAVSGVLNSFMTAVTAIDNSASSYTDFTIDTTSLFAVNNLALIIQMQGAQIDTADSAAYGNVIDYHNAGNYEYVRVQSSSGNHVRTTKIQRGYDVAGHVQLVRVPQYNNVSISGAVGGRAWDGTKGGVIAIDAIGSVTLNADIDASGLGFRGGIPKNDATYSDDDSNFVEPDTINGMKGEGIAARGDYSGVNIYARGKAANGGGGGNNHNAGGGGGANAGCGGVGGWGDYSYVQPYASGIGGAPMTEGVVNNKIFLGGGGGAGQANDGFLSAAGNGGGIVIITTNGLVGNHNKIIVNGLDGSDNHGYDGASGGGAGGAVLLGVSHFSNVNINCNGGRGGDPTDFMGIHLTAPGGGGGGGLIWVKNISAGTGFTYTADSGAAGICDSSTFGATAGCPGYLKDSLLIIHTTLGVKDVNLNDAFVVYPNPASEQLQVVTPVIMDELTITNSVGVEEMVEKVHSAKATIDIKALAPGIYYLYLKAGDQHAVKKFVKIGD